jgi:hypothetical protein
MADGIFDKVLNLVTGGTSGAATGILSVVTDVVKTYWPPEMSPEKRAEAELAMTKEINTKTIALMQDAHQADVEFNTRIKDLEGTAVDLKTIPYVGALMIFLRGCQRPVWGYATIALDYMWFSNAWQIPDSTQKSAAFLVLNILVLGFLFGERAMQNVMPYIIQFFGAKNGGK